jgi:hypothetical protein
MLARPGNRRCIECGRSADDPAFAMHKGRADLGPAYWCDRRALCSLHCSVAHTMRREREGTRPGRPAPDPFG